MTEKNESFRIAFDGSPWERPPHSMRRVLSLLLDAATQAGWSCELWTRNELQPEYSAFQSIVRFGPTAWRETTASVLWCPGFVDKPTALPIVSTIHDVNPLLPDGRPWPLRMWRRIRFKLAVRANIRQSWRIVTDTNFAMSSVEGAFPELRDRIAVVPLYADTHLRRLADADTGTALASLGLKQGYILFVGSLRKHKNWEGLLKAYALLPPHLRSKHRLVLAGPAHRAGQQAQDLARTLGLEDTVTLLGAVPEASVAALYSGAALFAFPSFMEGFGLPPLEAMACGVPVVATNRTSVPEVLGDAAVYVDPSDPKAISAAMLGVLQDVSTATALAQRGIVRASSFSPARTATAMLPLLREALVEKTSRMA